MRHIRVRRYTDIVVQLSAYYNFNRSDDDVIVRDKGQLYYKYAMSCTSKMDEPSCWICLDDTKHESLCSLGCLCKRAVHSSCAKKWYSERIQQLAYRSSVEKDWVIQTFVICETCKGNVSPRATGSWLEQMKGRVHHGAVSNAQRNEYAAVLLLIGTISFHMFWIMFLFRTVPDLCLANSFKAGISMDIVRTFRLFLC
jgi:hypothetical protein